MPGPVEPPLHLFRWAPYPSPSPSPSPSWLATAQGRSHGHQNASKQPVNFSPPLIAMVAIIFAAFLLVTYSRLISSRLYPSFRQFWRAWRRRRRRRRFYSASSLGDIGSPGGEGLFPTVGMDDDGFSVLLPYGLDDAVIKALPLSVYTVAATRHGSPGEIRECAVCLFRFEDDDCVRTLPVCSHAFHVDCIDTWLRSHGNCPLCRAGVFRPESPFTPVMAARIRPSFDGVLEMITLETPTEVNATEILPAAEEPSPRRFNVYSEDHLRSTHGHDFVLKRSFSFGFERNFPSERLGSGAATTSPCRDRPGSFWSKRPSPFGSLMTKPRLFSFKYYMKSPFFRRREGGGGGMFFPLSESGARFSGGGSSRRSKSMTSPMFARPGGGFPSSRLRCGDLEALLSPERYGRR